MKRIDSRIVKTFNNKFSQQYFIKLYDSNFRFNDFLGFRKFKFNEWGEKWTLLRVDKVFASFKQKARFLTHPRADFFKFFVIGLITPKFIKFDINFFLSYILHNIIFKYRKSFLFFDETQKKFFYNVGLFSILKNRVINKKYYSKLVILGKLQKKENFL